MQLSLLRAVERSGFVKRYYPVLVAGTKSKKCDKQLTFIVRVMFRRNFRIVSSNESVSDNEIVPIEMGRFLN
jgi:hypothetical protein